mgnify:CR=1 FL=1
MDSGLIGKIEKAKWYAQDPARVILLKFTVLFHGDHSDHVLTYDNGFWDCDCVFYATHRTCSHTMAIDSQLGAMLGSPSPVPS